MKKHDMLHELENNPDGEWTRTYVGFLRMMRPDWAGLRDEELVAIAIKFTRAASQEHLDASAERARQMVEGPMVKKGGN